MFSYWMNYIPNYFQDKYLKCGSYEENVNHVVFFVTRFLCTIRSRVASIARKKARLQIINLLYWENVIGVRFFLFKYDTTGISNSNQVLKNVKKTLSYTNLAPSTSIILSLCISSNINMLFMYPLS